MNRPDTTADAVQFGVELETYIPQGAGITVGAYHNGAPVLDFPPLAGRHYWRADRDSSILAPRRAMPCEFVSPVLSGDEGLDCLRRFVRFALVEAKAGVNASCGLH